MDLGMIDSRDFQKSLESIIPKLKNDERKLEL